MQIYIEPTTAAKISNPFYVDRKESVGVSAVGLAGVEQMTLQRHVATGNFVDLTEATAVLSVAQPNIRIEASGLYRISKPVTAGAAGASID